MLLVSVDYPYLISTLVFSNVYLFLYCTWVNCRWLIKFSIFKYCTNDFQILGHILSPSMYLFIYVYFNFSLFHLWCLLVRIVRHRCSTLLTEFGTALTTILPILFQYCYKYCYSDSQNLWAVMKAGGFGALKSHSTHHFFRNACTKSGSLRFFTVFRLLTEFVCFYSYEFWLSLWKIVRSSVILLLPLFNTVTMQV
jgi:hypothetical protein